MSDFHDAVSATGAENLVDESEVPVIPGRYAQDRPIALDGLPSFDELERSGVFTRKAVLSLADLRSFDSRRIGWLLKVHERFARAGGKLAVHSMRPQPMETLRFLRLHHVLHIAEDEAAALELLQRDEAVGAR
jgi:hypothetical protein